MALVVLIGVGIQGRAEFGCCGQGSLLASRLWPYLSRKLLVTNYRKTCIHLTLQH